MFLLPFTPFTHRQLVSEISLPFNGELLLIIPVCALALSLLSLRWLLTRKRAAVHFPPIIDIPTEELFNRPLEAYEAALHEHGPIIGVRRKGRLEYIVNRDYTKYVFADDRTLSFEQGVATILNLRFAISVRGGAFFKDVDRLVSGGMIPRIESITNKIFPVFLKHATQLVTDGQKPGGVDFFAYTHHSIAESMLTVVMGEQYVNDVHLKIIEDMAHDIANMTGIYSNTSFLGRTFPQLWKFMTWMRIIFGTLVYRYFWVLGPHIWRELRDNTFVPLHKSEKEYNEEEPLLHFMGRMFAREDGTVSPIDVFWSSCLVLSLIFASVHQTAVVAVWVVYELAARPSYIPAIQEELMNVAETAPDGSHQLSYESLRKAQYLDSFIREVLRLKGDTLVTCRQTVQDTPMGDYIIPKGHLVYPLASLSHRSREYYGEDATVFDGFRWVDKSQPAVMVSPAYFPFGLNRWACPGRVLAVAEMKMIVFTLLGLAYPSLEGGKYTVVDPLNATSVQPAGRLFLSPLDKPFLKL